VSARKIPGIDGLRAIAVSLVLIAHFGLERYVPGGFGVTLFFFISGFLITGLLMVEFENQGKISVPAFYMRRLLRLYPALVLAVLVTVFLYPALGGVVTFSEISASLFYYANYYNQIVVFGSAGKVPVGSFHPLSILWSLAIEEQYYVVFPFVMLYLSKNKNRMLPVFIAVAVVSLVWRIILQHVGMGERIYAATDTRMDSIIYGAIMAVLASTAQGKMWLMKLRAPVVVLVALLLLLSTFVVRDEFFRNTFRYSIQGLTLVPLVSLVCYSHTEGFLLRLLESKWFVLLGAWSYSLYLFHGIAILITENIFSVDASAPFAVIPWAFYPCETILAFIFAIFSYYVVELRFVKLRRHFGSHV
jgi:peptidoglycan/LPS O-acetylase OafA/YrhL